MVERGRVQRGGYLRPYLPDGTNMALYSPIWPHMALFGLILASSGLIWPHLATPGMTLATPGMTLATPGMAW